MIKQEDLDPQDQPIPAPTYHNQEIAQQYEAGLLSRNMADFSDIFAHMGVTFSTAHSGQEGDPPSPYGGQRILLSLTCLRCRWEDVPLLRQWITQFLADRQSDAMIVASGMVKHGETKIALDEQHVIEGYLVIGSTEQELHGSVTELVAEHLVAEGQIKDYSVFTTFLCVQ